MVDRILNHKLTKIWFALSVTAFVCLELSFKNKIGMILNIPFAFILALFIENKYKIINKLFFYKSRKYLFISLPIAVFFAIEINFLFQQRIVDVSNVHPFFIKIFSVLPDALVWFSYNCFSIVAVFIASFLYSLYPMRLLAVLRNTY